MGCFIFCNVRWTKSLPVSHLAHWRWNSLEWNPFHLTHEDISEYMFLRRSQSWLVIPSNNYRFRSKTSWFTTSKAFCAFRVTRNICCLLDTFRDGKFNADCSQEVSWVMPLQHGLSPVYRRLVALVDDVFQEDRCNSDASVISLYILITLLKDQSSS